MAVPSVVTSHKDEEITGFYDLAGELGRGTFSVVFSGKDKAGNQWAIKVISKKPSSADGDAAGDLAAKMAVIQNEVACWSCLGHPNIVQLKETFDTSDSYYIVQQLVTGGELFDQIVRASHYTEQLTRKYLLQLVSAIQHVHEHNIIHRDIKPENILMSSADSATATLLLADFGLATKLADTEKLTKAVGTPGYVAPEVLLTLEGGGPYGPAVDVWAVGVIAYILLSGCAPFYHADDGMSFELTLSGQVPWPETPWNTISAEAKDLISKILVIDPAKRLTLQQILAHPWMKTVDTTPGIHLSRTQANLCLFNSRRKWRMAFHATTAARRFASKKFGRKWTQS
eukprot:TRINITY_DN741_c0_g1_i4.p1 TRINITY_DN741_c0_g1~~TRINITY_DN741_c0_g1_i4.p1  ORF type:complete len:342 (+),score=81.21 TRINITY_DN741_c0_g1_i4:63-1088(+)